MNVGIMGEPKIAGTCEYRITGIVDYKNCGIRGEQS
jgi:hypothetical protein